MWSWHLWKRTAAVQCCHNQPYIVDKVIPIYFDREPPQVSQIFIFDKSGQSSNHRSALASIKRKSEHINCASNTPYVAILLDMGQKTLAFEQKWYGPESDEEGPSLRIYAAGIHPAIFPFIQQDALDEIRHLVALEKAPAATAADTRTLVNQMCWGSTPCTVACARN